MLLAYLVINRPVGFIITPAQINNSAAKYYQQGDYAHAEQLWLQALSTPSPLEKATIASNLAALYRRTARFNQAEQYFTLTYTLRLGELGPDHTNTAMALNNVADLETTLARYNAAEQNFRLALACRNLLPADRAVIRNNLGNLLRIVGRFAEAHRHLDANWNDQADLVQTYNNLGRLAEDEDRNNAALQFYQAALVISPLPAITANLGRLYLRQGNLPQARLLLEKALSGNPSLPERAVILESLGELLLSEDLTAEAIESFQAALVVREQLFGPRHPGLAPLLTNLATAFRKNGRHQQARRLETRANHLVEAEEQSRPYIHWRILSHQ